jgi:predicted transposase/invertase (TIGR01784 family)
VDNRRSEWSSIYTAKKEGKAEGLQEGLQKGEAIGREKGKKEALTEMALNLRRNGHAIDQIKALTGLSEEEIRKI